MTEQCQKIEREEKSRLELKLQQMKLQFTQREQEENDKWSNIKENLTQEEAAIKALSDKIEFQKEQNVKEQQRLNKLIIDVESQRKELERAHQLFIEEQSNQQKSKNNLDTMDSKDSPIKNATEFIMSTPVPVNRSDTVEEDDNKYQLMDNVSEYEESEKQDDENLTSSEALARLSARFKVENDQLKKTKAFLRKQKQDISQRWEAMEKIKDRFRVGINSFEDVRLIIFILFRLYYVNLLSFGSETTNRSS